MDRDDLFAQTVCRLAVDPATRRQVEALEPNLAVLRPPNAKQRIIVVRAPVEGTGVGADEQFRARLGRVFAAWAGEVVVIVVGGGDATRAVVRDARPARGRQWLLHLADDDHLSYEREVPAIERTIRRLEASTGPIDDATWQTFERIVETDLAAVNAEVHEQRSFGAVLAAGSTVATYSLLAVIVIMYLVELAFGGPDSVLALMRLGALSRERVEAGEWYRLLSVATLHGSLPHVGFGGLVLFSLGGFLEKIAGPARFTLLFVTSVLAGSLASIYLVHPTLSVGASGGLWGVLAAQAVLAWAGRGVLPAALIPSARKNALINLGLNVAVSFMPHVDWAAHAGGGLAGAIVMLLLLPGLPRLGATSGELPARPALWGPARAAAVMLGALFLAATVYAVWTGRVWELRRGPRYVRIERPEIQLSLEVPDALAIDQTLRGAVSWGDIQRDPVVCAIEQLTLDDADTELGPEVLTRLLSEVAEAPLPDGATRLGAPTHERLGDHETIVAEYQYPNQLRLTSALVLMPLAHYRLDCALWPDLPQWANAPREMAASMRTSASREE